MPRPFAVAPSPRSTSTGLGLIEIILFIAIVGAALAGVLVVYDRAVRSSADPLARKQAIAIAESLLNEVLAQPFTYCDPQDAANDPAAPPARECIARRRRGCGARECLSQGVRGGELTSGRARARGCARRTPARGRTPS